MDETTQGLFTIWINRSWRDVADKDYLSARLLNRYKLFQASVWSSLQAVEKYLKGILLFSYQSTKNYKHDLLELWRAVERLPCLNAELPSDCIEFLEYLTLQGANRYLDYPLSFRGYELFGLDRSVWHIRRYCQNLYLLPGAAELHSVDSARLLANLPREASTQAIKSFRIQYGYLETVVDDIGNPLRTALVWKNSYFGKNKKSIIRYAPIESYERPIYLIRPELLAYVEEVADIPKPILIELRKYRDDKLKEKAT